MSSSDSVPEANPTADPSELGEQAVEEPPAPVAKKKAARKKKSAETKPPASHSVSSDETPALPRDPSEGSSPSVPERTEGPQAEAQETEERPQPRPPKRSRRYREQQADEEEPPSDHQADSPESGPESPAVEDETRPGGGRSKRKRRPGRGRNRDEEGFDEPPKKKPLGPPQPCSGLLELSPKGFGFLRVPDREYRQSTDDVFVTPELVRTHLLRNAQFLEGIAQEGHRGPQMTEISRVNGRPPEDYLHLPLFEELTAINPKERIRLETESKRYTTRVIDMMTPIGKGQRGLIVAPPRTGKTTILKHIAEAIRQEHEDIHLIVLLVDERPEEVTDFARSLPGVELMASSNDSDPRNHTRIAEMTIERAKRLVEAGEDVIILLDSITRLARSFNNQTRGKGRTMSGGIDARALEIPRRLFAAARNLREGGSLTIVATALVETGSRMDDLVFQEFKGTGNMEVVLDRRMAEMFIYPAINIYKSGTRREELLLPAHQLEKTYFIRRGLSGHRPEDAMERMLSLMQKFHSNAQLLMEIKAPRVEA
ncbi:MAG: transcription termination factor Rho [Verrucomicrobiota bacterium]